MLTAASTAYVKTLQQRTSAQMQHNNSTQFAKPPCPTKNSPVGLTFDEKEFPALNTQNDKTNTAASNSTTKAANDSKTTSTTSATTETTTTTMTQQPYDYKKELARILHDIETKLKKQFEMLFAQMEEKLEKLKTLMTQQAMSNKVQDTKIDHFMRQHANQQADQEQFNETITKWLDFLVVNVEHLLSIANPLKMAHPLPKYGDGQLYVSI